MVSRRNFLQAGGALIVSFGAAGAQGPFDTHPSHIEPNQLDSWVAVSSDGTVTAHTGKCDLGHGMYSAQTQLVEWLQQFGRCDAVGRATLLDKTGHAPGHFLCAGKKASLLEGRMYIWLLVNVARAGGRAIPRCAEPK